VTEQTTQKPSWTIEQTRNWLGQTANQLADYKAEERRTQEARNAYMRQGGDLTKFNAPARTAKKPSMLPAEIKSHAQLREFKSHVIRISGASGAVPDHVRELALDLMTSLHPEMDAEIEKRQLNITDAAREYLASKQGQEDVFIPPEPGERTSFLDPESPTALPFVDRIKASRGFQQWLEWAEEDYEVGPMLQERRQAVILEALSRGWVARNPVGRGWIYTWSQLDIRRPPTPDIARHL